MALFQSENEHFESKKELLDAKMWYNFEFLGCGITPLPLKNFMHPSCQVLGAAPAIGKLIEVKNKNTRPKN